MHGLAHPELRYKVKLRAYFVVVVSVVDGKAIFLPDDIRFRLSHWGAAV